MQTFWHSSAHVLGEALEACFGVRLTIGPAVEEGFYYDCYMGDRTLTDAEKPVLEKKIEQVPRRLWFKDWESGFRVVTRAYDAGLKA